MKYAPPFRHRARLRDLRSRAIRAPGPGSAEWDAAMERLPPPTGRAGRPGAERGRDAGVQPAVARPPGGRGPDAGLVGAGRVDRRLPAAARAGGRPAAASPWRVPLPLAAAAVVRALAGL